LISEERPEEAEEIKFVKYRCEAWTQQGSGDKESVQYSRKCHDYSEWKRNNIEWRQNKNLSELNQKKIFLN